MFEDFSGPIEPYWTQTCIGNGSLRIVDSTLRMEYQAARQGEYVNAQIDDYGKRQRSAFPWRPPLRMEVRARSSLPAASGNETLASADMLRGTAGFGFWNYPFSVRGDPLLLPEAVWFFYASPPSNMSLVPHTPGWGWKAQVVHSMRLAALASALPLGITTAWARISGQTQAAQRWISTLTGAQEAMLPVKMESWHTYVLEWRQAEARFWVDGQAVLQAPQPPARPLGFVAWLDNQYAVVTPRGAFRFGTVTSGPQWFELDYVRIEAAK
jgi:hypothetical protein